MVETETWKSRPSVCSATATTVVSRIAMMEPRTTTVAMRESSGVMTEGVDVRRGKAAPLGDYFIILKDMDLSKSLCETVDHGAGRIGIRPALSHRVRRRAHREDALARGTDRALSRCHQDPDAAVAQRRRLHGRDGPERLLRSVLHHGTGRRSGRPWVGDTRAGPDRPPSEDRRPYREGTAARRGDPVRPVGAAGVVRGPDPRRAGTAARPLGQDCGGRPQLCC